MTYTKVMCAPLLPIKVTVVCKLSTAKQLYEAKNSTHRKQH